MKKQNIALALGIILTCSSFLTGCKIIDTGSEAQYTGASTFNAADEVSAMWDGQILPEMTENAQDLSAMLTSYSGKLSGSECADEFNGKSSTAAAAAANSSVTYIVQGSGTVTEIVSKDIDESASSKGYLTIKLDGYDGDETVKVNVGPVITSTSVRDSLSFISLGDYKDTTEWSKLSQSINNMVLENVISSVDLASLKDQKISFTGAFSTDPSNPTTVEVTPVVIETN